MVERPGEQLGFVDVSPRPSNLQPVRANVGTGSPLADIELAPW